LLIKVLDSKTRALDLVADLVDQYGSMQEIPAEDKKTIDRAWHRYSQFLVKWTKYHDDCDLYEESKSPDTSMSSNSKTDQLDCDHDDDDEDLGYVDVYSGETDKDQSTFNEEELDEAINHAIQTDDGARNLYTVVQDGESYGYKADHLETILISQGLDTLGAVCDYFDRHQLTENLSSPSLKSPTQLEGSIRLAANATSTADSSDSSILVVDTLLDPAPNTATENQDHTNATRVRTTEAIDNPSTVNATPSPAASSDSEESIQTKAMDHLAEMRLVLFSGDQPSVPETRLQLIDLALSLPPPYLGMARLPRRPLSGRRDLPRARSAHYGLRR